MLKVRRLFLPAFAFMGFPLSQGFNIQGTVLAVEWALGPVQVVNFTAARTVSRGSAYAPSVQSCIPNRI